MPRYTLRDSKNICAIGGMIVWNALLPLYISKICVTPVLVIALVYDTFLLHCALLCSLISVFLLYIYIYIYIYILTRIVLYVSYLVSNYGEIRRDDQRCIIIGPPPRFIMDVFDHQGDFQKRKMIHTSFIWFKFTIISNI